MGQTGGGRCGAKRGQHNKLKFMHNRPAASRQPAWLKVRGSKVQHMVAWSRLIMLRGVTFVSASTV